MNYNIIGIHEVERWNDAISDLHYSVYHTNSFCKLVLESHGNPIYLFSYQKDNIKFAFPFSIRHFMSYRDIYSPYGYHGFIGTNEVPDFYQSWTEYTLKENIICGYLIRNSILDPWIKNNISTPWPAKHNATGPSIYSLNLQNSELNLYNNLSTNHKRNLKKWHSHRYKIINDKLILAKAFVDLYPNFIKHIKANDSYNFNSNSLYDFFRNDSVVLLGASNNGKIEAVSCFLITEYICDFFLHASLPSTPYHARAIMWEFISHYCDKRFRVLHLGGGIKENDNLAAYKMQFGSTKLVGFTVKEIYNSDMFCKICHEKNVIYNQNAYFPPYYLRDKHV